MDTWLCTVLYTGCHRPWQGAHPSPERTIFMVTAIFAVLFASVMLFAGTTIWQSVIQSKHRIIVLYSFAPQTEVNDQVTVSFRPSANIVASPPPEFVYRETISSAHASISVKKWQSWCSTGYVAPNSVAKKWQESPFLNGNTKLQKPCLPRSTVNINEILPDRYSRIVEPLDLPTLLPPHLRLSFGFLVARELVTSGVPLEQPLLA